MKTFKGNILSQLVRAGMALVAIALYGTALAPKVKADTIFTYTGNRYNTCGGTYCAGGPYALAISFDTTLKGSALDNLPITNITATVTSFKFTDGTGLILDNSNSDLGLLDIEISTNASGKVVAWFVGAYAPGADIQMQTNWNSPFGFIKGADFSETTASFAGNFGFLSNDPGNWAATSTPEPPQSLLLGTGLLAVLALSTRRKRSTISWRRQ
jgi:hypothetical protein